MVLFFSGTGNSKYVAMRIADTLGDELRSINDRLKTNDTSPLPASSRLVIVAPAYAWRIPRVVRDWLLKTDWGGAKQVWFVMTCGSEIGNAAGYNRALCSRKGAACMGTMEIVMPENYIAMFSVPNAEDARKIVLRAEPQIDRAAAFIAAGSKFPPQRRNLYGRLMSGPVNPFFYAVCVKAKAFTADGKCSGCGKCVRLCSMNNIVLHNGKPLWGKNCTHCMACICYCPAEAIEYGKKSLGQPRYHLEAPDRSSNSGAELHNA